MSDLATDAALKAALRARLRAWRRQLPPRQRRRAAAAAARRAWRGRGGCLLRRARVVGLTWPTGSELDPRPLLGRLARHGRAVALPSLRAGGGLVFRRVPRACARRPRVLARRLRAGAHGLRHPPAGWRRVPRAALDVLVLPLLGFDAAGRRLGQGGGYYDRFLAPLAPRARPWRLGLAFAGQQLPPPGLPAEPHDVPLHAVATEQGLARARSGRASGTMRASRVR